MFFDSFYLSQLEFDLGFNLLQIYFIVCNKNETRMYLILFWQYLLLLKIIWISNWIFVYFVVFEIVLKKYEWVVIISFEMFTYLDHALLANLSDT